MTKLDDLQISLKASESSPIISVLNVILKIIVDILYLDPAYAFINPSVMYILLCILYRSELKIPTVLLKFYIYEWLWYLRRYARLSGYLSHVVLSICVGNRHLFPNQIHMKCCGTNGSVWAERISNWFIRKRTYIFSIGRRNTRCRRFLIRCYSSQS